MSQELSVHQRFERQAIIGRGGSGFVYKGIDKHSGQAVALKIINLDTPEDEVADIQHEVALLTQLRDAPNVTKYYGCFLDWPRLWIAMELAQGGSVSSLMKACSDSIIEERFMVVIIREVLAALAFLHKSAIIHRDIKAANVLVASSGRVMLCDFGISALLSSNASKRNTLIGTPHWMAPEVANSSTYDVTADIWSLGIFAYEMAKGSPPHSDLRDYEVVRLIPKAKTPSLQDGDGSPGLREFVSSCLQAAPSEVRIFFASMLI
jgi:serine/threonine protein kinase